MAPRKFDSEIIVDGSDRWIFRGSEITQPDILKYFRNNLKENQKGIFIENVFGELSEHGYIHSVGFPCHVLAVHKDPENLIFYTDDDKNFIFPEFEIYQTKENRIIGIHSLNPKIKYSFDWNAAGQLAEFMDEENGSTYILFGDVKMELPIFEEEIEVPLPLNYD